MSIIRSAIEVIKIMVDVRNNDAEVHENGHAAAARYYGMKVHENVVDGNGISGHVVIDIPKDPYQYVVIAVAGIVAEDIAHGREPGVSIDDPHAYYDRAIASKTIASMNGNEDEMIKQAVVDAARIIREAQ